MQTLPAPRHCSGQGPPLGWLGSSTWRMFCGPNGVSWHTDVDEAAKEAAAVDIGAWAQPPPKSTDNKELSFADQVPMALRDGTLLLLLTGAL